MNLHRAHGLSGKLAIKQADAEDYVVCGWYTPDYGHWCQQLQRDLILHRQPFDFQKRLRPENVKGWEETTMMKAQEVLAAIERHPGKTLIFIDVDCRVAGNLAPLVQLRGDVGFFVHPRRRALGHAKVHVRSGTMVFKATPGALRFVERWAALSAQPEYGDVDQDSLMLALDTPGVTFEQLDVKWCCTSGDDCSNPVIIHDSASKSQPKIGTTRRRFVRLLSLLAKRKRAIQGSGERMSRKSCPERVPAVISDEARA